jgi:amino acid transporter
MELLSSLNTINLSGNALLISAFVSVVIVGLLITIIVILFRQNQYLKRPKFGFLGKPLYMIILVVVTVSSVYFINTRTTDPTDITANVEVTINFNYQVISTNKNTVSVRLNAIPIVNKIEWGKLDEPVTLYWNINGPKNYTFIEYDLTQTNKGGIIKDIEKGDYQVDLLMIYKGKSYNITKKISF